MMTDPERAGRTFWTAKAFHGFLKSEHRIECGYETVRRFFREQGFRLLVPRPWPERQEAPEVQQKREGFRRNLEVWAQAPDVELWFSDETGVEGEPRPYRRWAPKGSEPHVAHNGDHIRMNALGMVCPRNGEFFAIEASHCDTDVFQAFLDTANRTIRPTRRRNILIIDNASWHKSAGLRWGAFEPQYLPPYSPDLNPIEWLWLVMKKKWFNNIHCKTVDTLIERLDKALLDFIENPQAVAAITNAGILH
jgi:transposase